MSEHDCDARSGPSRRRRLVVLGPRLAVVALLVFAGVSKASSYALGLPTVGDIGASAVVEGAFAVLGVVVTIIELLLAWSLVFLVAPRRLFAWVMRLAFAWGGALIMIQALGFDASKCGCFGPVIPLQVEDHILLTVGTLVLCVSQCRRLSWSPRRMFSPRPGARWVGTQAVVTVA